jgi:hypothetical protein
MHAHTLTEMTNLIAEARDVPRNEWPQLHRAGRNWWNKGLLVPADLEASENEPARFDDATVCKACLFGVLSDMHFDAAMLRKADLTMNEMVEHHRSEGAIHLKRGIEVAIEGIRSGEPWFLHLQLVGSSGGVRQIIGGFRRSETDDINPTAARILADYYEATGQRILGLIVLPAHEILAGLIALLDKTSSEPIGPLPPKGV